MEIFVDTLDLNVLTQMGYLYDRSVKGINYIEKYGVDEKFLFFYSDMLSAFSEASSIPGYNSF